MSNRDRLDLLHPRHSADLRLSAYREVSLEYDHDPRLALKAMATLGLLCRQRLARAWDAGRAGSGDVFALQEGEVGVGRLDGFGVGLCLLMLGETRLLRHTPHPRLPRSHAAEPDSAATIRRGDEHSGQPWLADVGNPNHVTRSLRAYPPG
jgi:hypothetical protein